MTPETQDAIEWDRFDTHDREADRMQQLEDDVTELISSFGKRAFVAILLRSEIADDLERMGIGGSLTAINRILARMIDSMRPRLEADCLALASGLSVRYGKNQSDVAKAHGVTRAYVSLRVKEIRDDLGLPKTPHNKSDAATENYRLANRSKRVNKNNNQNKETT